MDEPTRSCDATLLALVTLSHSKGRQTRLRSHVYVYHGTSRAQHQDSLIIWNPGYPRSISQLSELFTRLFLF